MALRLLDNSTMRSPVPVAVFFSSFEPSAAAHAVLEVLPHLDRNRFDVRLACIDRRGAWLERAEAETGQAMAFPLKGFHHPSAVTETRRFTRWLSSEGIAVVHAVGGRAEVFALPASAFAAVPVRIATRTHISPERRPAYSALRRAAYACAQRVVATSATAAAQLAREKVPASRVRLIAPGIDASAWSVERAGRPMRRLAIPSGLGPDGLALLCEAAAFVAQRVKDLELVFDARGVAHEAVRHAARRHGVERHVRLEPVPGPDRLAAADLFVHPGDGRAAARHVLQAMASGLPVVVTRESDAAALVDHQRTGVIVAPGDARALAWALLDLVQWPVHARRLGAAARATVERHHRLDATVTAFDRLYLDALATRHPWLVADAHVAAS